MKKKALRFLSTLCGTCLGIIGIFEVSKLSLFFFGEPKFPEKTKE